MKDTLITTVIAVAEISENRFVGADGTVGVGKSLGVTRYGANEGEACDVISLGEAEVTAAESVSVGDYVKADADGKAVKDNAGGDFLVMTAGEAGDLIKVFCAGGKASDGAVRRVKAVYDFDADGGAAGDITLGENIPAGSIIRAVVANEITGLTSGGSATLTLKAGSTALTGATAFGDVPAPGEIALASSATAIAVSAESELTLTIGTAALTAGKVAFYVEYYLA